MREKILLIEDQDAAWRSTSALLDVMGYEAVRVKDAKGALDAAAKEHPDAILQDIQMPGLDLPELVRGLRENPATARIPLLFFGPGFTNLHEEKGEKGDEHHSPEFFERELSDALAQALRRKDYWPEAWP